MELKTLDIKKQREMNPKRWKTNEESPLAPPVVPASWPEKISKLQHQKREARILPELKKQRWEFGEARLLEFTV